MFLVVLSLLQAAENARDQQELDARRNAGVMAQAARAALARPAVLALTAPAERFSVTGGRIVVPPEVGWIEQLEALPADPVAAAKLTAAARQEFADSDPEAAARTFDELLGDRGPQGRARLPALAAAAWQAHRQGDPDRRERLMAPLRDELAARAAGDLALPEVTDALASALLLDAASGRPAPPFLRTLVPPMPAEQAGPLLRRLAEHGWTVDDVAAAHASIAARRSTLRRAFDAIRDRATSPRTLGDRLLLWFPTDGATAGSGALCDPRALAAQLGRGSDDVPPVPDLGRWDFDSPPQAGEPVVDGMLWIAPRAAVTDVPLSARPAAAFAAAAVLLLLLLGSLLLAARAVRRESRAAQERAEFVTVVTHELKTPLAAIRLIGEMLLERRVPADRVEEYYRLLAGEAARLSMLIENVLDLGRMERGERAYDLRECDLLEVVGEATTLFAPIAEQDGLRLDTALDERPAPARADRKALLQALLNVLDNARKYAAPGRSIAIAARRAGDHLELLVRDFGPGVPAGERETIFARFRRGQRHSHGAIPGVGLGLYLARAIARHHGGDLRCVPPRDGGGGSEFVFTLPLDRARTEAAA